MKFKVRDRVTGNERLVTAKAYAAMGPKVYEKLATVDDDGNEISAGQSSPNQRTPLAQRSVKGAAPVVVSSKLVAPKPAAGNIEPEDNDAGTESDQNYQSQESPALPEKRKPGRQPGSKNKSISSNSTADEK